MKTIMGTLLLCGWLVALAVAGEDTPRPTTDDAVLAARLEFIKSFKHAGLDSTADDAKLLRILVEGAKYKRGVEVGSFKGFGAVNMGMAFEKNGGQLFTLEIDPQIAEECRGNLKKVWLDKTVTVVVGDALQTLPKLEGEFDFVFIDARKEDYMKYLKAIEPKLKPGAMVVADNTIQSAKQMKDFLDYLTTSPDYDAVTVRASMEKRDGMTIAYKVR
ncbi:MAG: class I SAM-dependent methyltransferase [Planctomycetota bacterium]|nr:class I SAM-dependent methyltransferase [Planctomycetota bacterium]